MTIDFNFELVRAANKVGANWQETANYFTVTLNGQTFDHYRGIKKGDPFLDDVLYCLLRESDADGMTFEEWCSELDFNSDSIKDLKIYQECLENAQKLKKTGIDIDAERERLSDY